jgi:WD40 repeat protein
MLHSLRLFLSGLVLAAALSSSVGPAESELIAVPGTAEKAPRVDVYGDPLPAGAIARLGSRRFRYGFLLPNALSADGSTLLSASGLSIHVWECRTGKLLLQLWGESLLDFGSPFLSPDGRQVGALVGDNTVIWDVKTGQRQHQWKADGGVPFACAPDGRSVWMREGNGNIRIHDAATGKLRQRLRNTVGAHPCRITRDGRFAVVWNQTAAVKLDVRSGREISSRRFPQLALHSAVTTDLRLFAVYNPGIGVIFWDPATGQSKGKLAAAGVDPEGMTFTPDGRQLVTIHRDSEKMVGEARIWDVATGKHLRSFPVPYLTDFPLLAADGRLLICASNIGMGGGILSVEGGGALSQATLDFATGKPLPTPPGSRDNVIDLTFAPDGKTIFTTDYQRLLRWDAGTGKRLQPLGGERIHSVVKIDARSVLVLVVGDKADRDHSAACRMQLLDVATGKVIPAPVSSLRFADSYPRQLSVRGSFLLALFEKYPDAGANAEPVQSSPQRSLCVWDLANGRKVGSYRLDAAAPSANLILGKTVLAGIQSTAGPPSLEDDAPSPPDRLIVWNAASGRRLMTAELPAAGVTDIAATPDGQNLVTVCSELVPSLFLQGRVRGTSWLQVWERATGTVRWQIKHERAPAREAKPGFLGAAPILAQDALAGVTLAPDGRTIVTVRGDRTLVLWDFWTGKELLRRTADMPIEKMSFSPDGRLLATSLTDGTALVWDVAAVTHREQPRIRLSAQEANECWAQLAGDAQTAHKAMAKLLNDPETALALCRKHLKPAPQRGEEIQKLIGALDAPKYAVRDKANQQLLQLGPQAESALEAALKRNPSLETGLRIEAILRVSWKVRSKETLRNLRVVEILGHLATPDALTLLMRMAKGDSSAHETKAAQAAVRWLQAAAKR